MAKLMCKRTCRHTSCVLHAVLCKDGCLVCCFGYMHNATMVCVATMRVQVCGMDGSRWVVTEHGYVHVEDGVDYRLMSWAGLCCVCVCVHVCTCVCVLCVFSVCVGLLVVWLGLSDVCFSYIRCVAGLVCWRRCVAGAGRGLLTLCCVDRKLI